MRGSHPPNCCRRLKPLKVGVHVAFRQLCWLPCNFTFLHVYMLTEQSLMASAQQYFAGSSVICVLLLGARNMEYLHVFLFTKKNFCHVNSFGNNVDIWLVLFRHHDWLPATSSTFTQSSLRTILLGTNMTNFYGSSVDLCLVLLWHRP